MLEIYGIIMRTKSYIGIFKQGITYYSIGSQLFIRLVSWLIGSKFYPKNPL